MTYETDKFLNAVLFFGKKTEPKLFGITKLLKLLFLADFEHYKKYGRPIIGDFYIKLPKGPVPSISYNLYTDSIKSDSSGEFGEFIKVSPGRIGSYDMEKIEPLVEPNLGVFSKSDLEIMGQVAKDWYSATATDLIKKVYERSYVNSAQLQKTIPYWSVFEDEEAREIAREQEEESREFTDSLSVHD